MLLFFREFYWRKSLLMRYISTLFVYKHRRLLCIAIFSTSAHRFDWVQSLAWILSGLSSNCAWREYFQQRIFRLNIGGTQSYAKLERFPDNNPGVPLFTEATRVLGWSLAVDYPPIQIPIHKLAFKINILQNRMKGSAPQLPTQLLRLCGSCKTVKTRFK